MFIDSRLDISPQTEGSSCSTFELNKTPLITNGDRLFHSHRTLCSQKNNKANKKGHVKLNGLLIFNGYIAASKMILFFVLTG